MERRPRQKRIIEKAAAFSLLSTLSTSPAEAVPAQRLDVVEQVTNIPEATVEQTPGMEVRLETENGPVHVRIPENYDPTVADTVVYVHGYYVHLDDALQEHRLTDQFRESDRTALTIIPEAPAGNHEPVRWNSLQDLQRAVFQSMPEVTPPTGELVVMAHSGGFRSVEAWLAQPPEYQPDQIILLDAMYSAALPTTLQHWMLADPSHSLVVTAEYGKNCTGYASETFANQVGATVLDSIPLNGELPADTHSQFVYMKSQFNHHDMPKNLGPILHVAQQHRQLHK